MKQHILIDQSQCGAHFVLDAVPVGTALGMDGAHDSFVPVDDGAARIDIYLRLR